MKVVLLFLTIGHVNNLKGEMVERTHLAHILDHEEAIATMQQMISTEKERAEDPDNHAYREIFEGIKTISSAEQGLLDDLVKLDEKICQLQDQYRQKYFGGDTLKKKLSRSEKAILKAYAQHKYALHMEQNKIRRALAKRFKVRAIRNF